MVGTRQPLQQTTRKKKKRDPCLPMQTIGGGGSEREEKKEGSLCFRNPSMSYGRNTSLSFPLPRTRAKEKIKFAQMSPLLCPIKSLCHVNNPCPLFPSQQAHTTGHHTRTQESRRGPFTLTPSSPRASTLLHANSQTAYSPWRRLPFFPCSACPFFWPLFHCITPMTIYNSPVAEAIELCPDVATRHRTWYLVTE